MAGGGFSLALVVLVSFAISAQALLPAIHVPGDAPYYTAETPKQTTYAQVVASGLTRGSDDLPPTDPRIAPGDLTFPEQIQLAYQSPTSVVVSWVTGNATVSQQSTPLTNPDPSTAPASVVKFGTSSGSLGNTANGAAITYTYFYNDTGVDDSDPPIAFPVPSYQYLSGFIHKVTLSGLSPSTTYYYQVGDGASKQSAVFSFKTLQPLGPTFNPYRISVFADVGQTFNSTTTIDHMVQSNGDVVFHIADYSYADDYCSNGLSYLHGGCDFQTYQPVWDREYRLMQPLLSHVPFLGICGNHEIETQADGREFVSYLARNNFPTTIASNGASSNTRLYYSADLPGLHTIWMNPYIAFDPSSAQYQWLLKDLAAVDRTVTPWLLVFTHPPYYSTYKTHYKEQECFRETYEDIFYQNGVDGVLHGHVHAYERSNRVYNYNLDACAPFQITIGDGGNIEELYNSFADEPNNCPSINDCATYQNGSYCYTSQPIFSAYREPSFGHGTLDMVDANTAIWTWHRNQDGEATAKDSVTFKRSPNSQCPNHALPAGKTCAGAGASNSGANPNQCFNADGSYFVCCPGACPVPGPIPYCAGVSEPLPGQPLIEGTQYPRVLVTSSPGGSTPPPTAAATSAPAAGGSTPAPTAAATTAPAPTFGAVGGVCNPSSSLPNQCFNAGGDHYTCCPGSCAASPGATPACA